MIVRPRALPYRLAAAGLALTLASACSAWRPTESAPPTFYSLDGARAQSEAPETPRAAKLTAAPTLIVNPPRAAAGFNSQRMVYVRTAHQLEYYAHSEWIDSPARMMAPLIVAAIEAGGAFRAVVQTPSVAAGELRLDTEIIRLQHELSGAPSRVRLTLRAYLVDNTTRRVLAWREFEQSVAVASEDPYGAVVAANRATQAALQQLAQFCAETAGAWQP